MDVDRCTIKQEIRSHKNNHDTEEERQDLHGSPLRATSMMKWKKSFPLDQKVEKIMQRSLTICNS